MSDILAKLVSRKDVGWFLDSNAILSGFATWHLHEYSRIHLVPQVLQEIRKRPRQSAANAFIDDVPKVSGTMEGDYFVKLGFGPSFDFVATCACMPSPLLRKVLGNADTLDGVDAVNRQLQKATSKIDLFDFTGSGLFEYLKAHRLVTDAELTDL